MGQPTIANPIGYEIADPPLFTNSDNPDCPVYSTNLIQARCRYSDASLLLATYDIAPAWHGTIASTYINTITINDTYSITNTTTIVGAGWPIRKVGRTTGTTAGSVRRICADVAHSRLTSWEDAFLLCQGETADLVMGGGDSGGPVYADDIWGSGWGYHNPVALQGILWGRGYYNSFYYYSLFPHIDDELSAVTGFRLRARM